MSPVGRSRSAGPGRVAGIWTVIKNISVILLIFSFLLPGVIDAADVEGSSNNVVEHAIRPVMEQFGVPGMAVGIVVKGQGYVFHYGTASRATGRAVTDDTLFEIGSISKTFTATLAAYAQVDGNLSLADRASRRLPSLRGSAFDHVSLLNLGTHTSGGLPLQVPDEVTNDAQLMAFSARGSRPTLPVPIEATPMRASACSA